MRINKLNFRNIMNQLHGANSEFYTSRFQVLLTQRDRISHDSYMFRFEFKNPKDRLGMPVIQHIWIYGQNQKNEEVGRKYTAVIDDEGYFSIPIKIYRPNEHPSLPEGGQLTPWLEKIQVRSSFMQLPYELTIQRLMGKLNYIDQQFYISPKNNQVPSHFKTVLMVCGGSGITPAYQLIKAVCNNPQDNTKITLLYANRTEEDIWLKKELDNFHQNNQQKFSVHYTLDNPPENWQSFKGFVTIDMIKKIFPNPDNQTLAIVCGPKPMNKLVLQLFSDFGVKQEHILKF